MQPDSPTIIRACMLQVARLAADGTTPAGPTNAYRTKNFATLTMSPDIDEGEDFSTRNACGDLSVTARDRPAYRRWNLNLTLLNSDPELFELMVEASLITSTAAAPRNITDATTTTGSNIVRSPSGAFTNLDRGAGIEDTGAGTVLPADTIITEINSPIEVVVSNNATATAAGDGALTITPVAQSIGWEAPEVNVQASGPGVSLELWSNAYIDDSPAPVLPYYRWAIPRSYWRFGERELGGARSDSALVGYTSRNPNWGNGPFNDWREPAPSTRSLSRPYGVYRTDTIPTQQVGYLAVPAQA